MWWTTESPGDPALDDGPGHDPAETTRRLCVWGDKKELDRIVALFAADVVFDTPISDEFRLRGRDEVRFLLSSVFSAVDELRFHTDFGEGDCRVVVYHGVIDGKTFDEAILLRFNERNEIREAVAFVRPLSGLLPLSTLVGPSMIRRNGRTKTAAGSQLFLSLLTRLWALIDRTLVPLCSPRARKIR